MWKTLLITAIISSLASPIFAQMESTHSGISSERATIIGDSRTVPAGHFIFEGGVTSYYFSNRRTVERIPGAVSDRTGRSRQLSNQAFFGPGATLRIGLDQGVEFRVLLPDRHTDIDDHMAESLVAPGGFGTKIELSRTASLDVAMDFMILFSGEVPSVTFTSSYSFTSGQWARAKASFAKREDENFFITDVAFALLIGSRPSSDYEVYFGVEGGTGDRLDFGLDLPTQFFLLSGMSYQLTKFLLMDFGAGIRLTKGDQNAQIRTGLSAQI